MLSECAPAVARLQCATSNCEHTRIPWICEKYKYEKKKGEEGRRRRKIINKIMIKKMRRKKENKMRFGAQNNWRDGISQMCLSVCRCLARRNISIFNSSSDCTFTMHFARWRRQRRWATAVTMADDDNEDDHSNFHKCIDRCAYPFVPTPDT